MKRRWQAIITLFDRREPATALACIRITAGCVVFYSLISAAWAGLVGTLWVDIKHGGFMPVRGLWPIRWLGGATPTVMYSLFTGALIGAGFLVAGLFARVAALVTLLCYASLVSTHADTSGGADMMITNALWLLALAKSDATLSLATRFRTGVFASAEAVPAWPRYLFIFQIVVIYTAAGWNKLTLTWLPDGGFTALHYVLQDPTFIRFGGDAFTWFSPLTRVATALTIAWELTTILLWFYFYCFYTRERGGRLRRAALWIDWRKPWALVGIGFHIGICVTLNVGAFSFIALAYYIALWRPAELESFAARIAARWASAPDSLELPREP